MCTSSILDCGGGGRYDGTMNGDHGADTDDDGHHALHIYIHLAWNQTVVANRLLVTERSSTTAREMTLRTPAHGSTTGRSQLAIDHDE